MRSDIMSVADQKVAELGLDVEEMSFAIDPYNEHWKAYNKAIVEAGGEPYIVDSTKSPESKGMPVTNRFWAIKYDNLNPFIADGDLIWVFVDQNFCKAFDHIHVRRG